MWRTTPALRAAAILLCAAVLFAPPTAGAQAPYGWTISASPSDPFATLAPFAPGLQTYYLWLTCCDPGQVSGMSTAEFALVASPAANTVIAFQPVAGFVSSGGPADLHLTAPSCTCGPILVGHILVIVNQPGSLCIAASGNGVRGTYDCDPAPTLHPIDWFGLDFGAGGCGQGAPCQPIDGAMPCCLQDGTCENRAPIEGCPGFWHPYGSRCAGVQCGQTTVGAPEPGASTWGRTKSVYR